MIISLFLGRVLEQGSNLLVSFSSRFPNCQQFISFLFLLVLLELPLQEESSWVWVRETLKLVKRNLSRCEIPVKKNLDIPEQVRAFVCAAKWNSTTLLRILWLGDQTRLSHHGCILFSCICYWRDREQFVLVLSLEV